MLDATWGICTSNLFELWLEENCVFVSSDLEVWKFTVHLQIISAEIFLACCYRSTPCFFLLL